MKTWMRKKKEFVQIEYQPRNVKELLVEMKDTSEFMVDLAFSAVIFDSREMADEVEEKEYEMDKLLYQIRMGTLIAAQTVEDARQLSGILQVAGEITMLGWRLQRALDGRVDGAKDTAEGRRIYRREH